MKVWKASKIDGANYIGEIEIENYGRFSLLETKKRLVFGGTCNIGFIESGYMKKEHCFSLDENLQELVEELETYYRDGAQYTNNIVCNERM